MEAERYALQDNDFAHAAVRTILAAIRDTSQKVYNSRWESFSSRCGENPVSTSMKHVLEFLVLQVKSETLAVKHSEGLCDSYFT